MTVPDGERPAGHAGGTDAVRIAVVGVGHLGRTHAKLLAGLPEAELVGVVDLKADRAAALGRELGVRAGRDPCEDPLRWGAEAVSLAVPTESHARLAEVYLEQGLDVLVEKPIARTSTEGERLCRVADARGRILQVGHVERFNPVVRAAFEAGVEPRYIEAERLAPFSFRSTDIGVVLDLMVHDLDLVLAFLDAPVEDVEAFGGAIFTPEEDLASARLCFADGAVARLTANRVALRPSRRMRMFSKDSYVSLDFSKRYGLIIKKAPGWELQDLDLKKIDPTKISDLWKFVFEGLLTVKELRMPDENPLEEELRAFLDCVRNRRKPLVDGWTGLRALEVAGRVQDAIRAHRW